MIVSKMIGKGKIIIPATGHGGPLGCKTSRLKHFLDNLFTDGSEAVNLAWQLAALYPQEYSWYSFLLEAQSRLRSIVWLERSCQLKNSMTLGIESITFLLACGTVPQSTMAAPPP
jgi:hypothetical protein